MSSLPGSEVDFSEPGSSFTITSGSARPNNPKLQNLDHLIKLQAEGYASSGSTTDASKLIYYLDNFNGKMPYTMEKALDTAIANITDPTGLELVLRIVTKWPDSDLNSYNTSQQITAAFIRLMPIAFNLAQLCRLMAKAATNEFVSQSDILGLSRHIIDFLLRDADSAKKQYPLKLLVQVFQERPEMQGPILDLALQYLRKPLEYVRDQSVSKYSDKKISALPVLILEFIQSVGALPLSTWDEDVAYSRKSSFIEHCQQQFSLADEYTNTLVRVCVDLLQAPTVGLFIDDVLMALEAAELCASETVVRCLTISLLLQCKSFHNRYQLPPAHYFEVLARIQRALYLIFKSTASPQSLGQIIDYLIGDGHTNAALYFATLECKDKAENWRDFHMRFTNPQTRISNAPKKWTQVLRAGKIGKLYQHSVDVMLILSESGVPGPAYIEILKSLATVVYEHPSFFKKIEPHLMSQLEVASSFVCDWTAHIVSNYIAATNVDFSLIARTMIRVNGPGNLNYKKRCIKLLDQAFSSGDTTLQTLAWKYLLLMSDDPKASIAQQASKQLCDYIDQAQIESLCSIFQQILRLGPKYGALISSILCKPLQRKSVHQLVSYLLQSLDSNPDYRQLKVASLFIAANGLYLPPSKVPILVGLSVCEKSQPEHRLIVLKMLEAALTSKPKIILSPKVVSGLYKKILAMLVVYGEHETECAGRIIWELASLGRDEEKKSRKEELMGMYYTCLKALSAATTTSKSDKVIGHLCSILSVGSRIWAQRTDSIPVLLSLVEKTGGELRLQVIRVICRVCTHSPDLFLEGPCHEFFRRFVFKNQSGPEWSQFMSVFLEFLESQDQRVQHQHSALTLDVLHGHSKSLVADSTLGGLFQTYFGALEKCALGSNSSVSASSSVTAARLLCRGIITSKVDASNCTATIVTLCCNRNVEISQVAHECFNYLMEQGQLSGFAKGLSAAGRISSQVFKRVWEEIHEDQVQAALLQLVERFSSDHKDYALSVFDGLTLASLKLADARYLEQILDDYIYNFRGDAEIEALLIVLRAIIQYKYAIDSALELEIPTAEFVVENVDPEQLRESGDFQGVLSHVAGLGSNKRVRN